MFDQPTVFILGAGASWHYGFPTGDTLVRDIAQKGQILAGYYEHSIKVGNSQCPKFFKDGPADITNWKDAWHQCARLNDALKTANPLVIDYFLGQNPTLQEVGKLLIAWVLLERYDRSGQGSININRPPGSDDDWCRFITHHLALGCQQSADLLKNNVSFVTFNYDLSLEARLSAGLRHETFSGSDIEKFLSGTRIIHVYGKLLNSQRAPIPWSIESDGPDRYTYDADSDYRADFTRLLDFIHDASADIRVIDPHNKNSDTQSIEFARHQISNASRLFILGYGFDENNNQRLQLSKSIRERKKHVYFTNFENNRNINKRASKIIFGDENHFRTEAEWNDSGLYERSTRSVYEAFARDFNL